MASENEPPAPVTGSGSSARSELHRLEEKLTTIADPDIRSVLVARIQQLYAELPPEPPTAEAAAVEAPAPEEPDEPLLPPTQEQMERAESLVRQAKVERMRGNRQAASDLLRQATEIAPTAPALLESLGDDAMERHNYKQARQAYERALKVSPKNIALERKHAESILKAESGLTVEDQLRLGLSGSPFISSEDMKASRKSATILNAFLPGLGQIALGQTTKGAILMAVWILCLVGIVLLRGDFTALMQTTFTGQSDQKPTLLVLLPIFVALIVYVGALADLKGTEPEGIHKVDHPKPPVNLPFE
ncbi:MAG TPA: tetratricopeptide repeat protein [Fimbriimonas sp.]